MKIATIIIALSGVLGFLSLPLGILSPDSSPWPVLLTNSVFGVFVIWIAFGIWKRRIVAWRYGFVAIALSAVEFVIQVYLELPTVSTGEKAVIIISCLVGGILVVAFWSFIWYRQKKWFTDEAEA